MAGFKFRRQYSISPYIVDFVCLEAGLVIEVDGGQHMTDAHRDRARDRFIEKQKFRVIRFWDNDVLLRADDVLEAILLQLNRPSP